MVFYYIFSGWDGSAADSTMIYDAHVTDLHMPVGKYYLADAGFPICKALLVPKQLCTTIPCVTTVSHLEMVLR